MTMKRTKTGWRFALCLDNSEYPASLERWKIYQVLPDADAEEYGQMRVADESGGDYLYPVEYLKSLRLSPQLVRLFPRGVRAKSRRPAAIRTA
jgi:hypothetical protein